MRNKQANVVDVGTNQPAATCSKYCPGRLPCKRKILCLIFSTYNNITSRTGMKSLIFHDTFEDSLSPTTTVVTYIVQMLGYIVKRESFDFLRCHASSGQCLPVRFVMIQRSEAGQTSCY